MKAFYIFASVATSALIVAAVVIALWMAGSASSERARFSSLEVAPQDVDVIFAVNTDPTSPQWLAVNDSLDAINAKDPIREAVDDALAEFDLEWERDIVPVAGDEAFFAVPDITNVEDGRGFIGGFLIRDEDKAQGVLDRARERAEQEGEGFEEEEYEGVTIVYVVAPDIDGDPTTSSDCEVDENNTILCDDEAPIPADPFWQCAEISFELSQEGDSTTEAPEECEPFFQCPLEGLGPEGQDNLDDLDGNGSPDSCDESSRIRREWEESIEFAEPYQDCADLEDVSDYQCEDVPPVVIAQAAGVGGAVAIVEDVLVVGGAPDDVKAVIDVAQGRAPNAQANERLQEFRASQKEDFLIWGYADLAPVWQLAEEKLAEENLATFGGEGSDEAPADDARFTIDSIHSDVVVPTNGLVRVTETIVVDFGEPRHGIFRDIPLTVPYDEENDRVVDVTTVVVKRDGQFEPNEESPGISALRVKIGDPDVLISGRHEYEISYNVPLAAMRGEDGAPELNWSAVDTGWPVTVKEASATVGVPGILDASCLEGVRGSTLACESAFTADTAEFRATAPLQPGEGLTVIVQFADGNVPVMEPLLVPSGLFNGLDAGTGQQAAPIDPAELIDKLKGPLDRAGFSISSMSDGFAFDLTVLEAPDYEPEEPVGPFESFEPKLAELLPADTMFYLSAFDLYNRAGRQASSGLSDIDTGEGKTADDFLNELLDETGIDLEEDFLSLLTGEVAFAGNLSNFDAETPDFELVALADVNDGDKTSETLEKLGEYLENHHVIRTRADAGAWQWSFVDSPGAEPVGWAVRDDRLIIGYPDIAATEVSAHDNPLADTRDWKRTLELLPDEKIFVGFVSVARVLEEIRKTEGAEAEFRQSTDGKLSLEDLEAIRSVGFSANTELDGFSLHAVLFVEDN